MKSTEANAGSQGSGTPVAGRSFAPALVLFTMMTGFSLIRTGRDALFFQDRGIFELPLAYLIIAALAIPQSMLVLWMLRRFGSRLTRVLIPAFTAVTVLAVSTIAEPGGGWFMTGFFVFVPLVFSVLFSLSWLITGELNEHVSADEKLKAYSRVGAASIAGGIVGSGLASAFPYMGLGAKALLAVGAGVILLGVACIIWTHAKSPLPALSVHKNSSKPDIGLSTVFAAPNARLVLGVSMAAALSALLIDFQFYLAAAQSQGSGTELVSFFARIYLVLNVGSLFLQLLIAPRVQKRLGLAGALQVLPTVLLGGVAVGIASSTLAVRAGLRVAEGGLKAGLHRTLWEQTYLQFPSALRSAAKVMIDGLGARLAEGTAALALYLWLLIVVGEGSISDHSSLWVTIFLGGTTATWFVATGLLKKRMAAIEVCNTNYSSWAAPPPDF